MSSAPIAWTCDLHGITTLGDCPRCDEDAFNAHAEDPQPVTECATCHVPLHEGDVAWADKVKRVDLATGRTVITTVYLCDDCDAKATAL